MHSAADRVVPAPPAVSAPPASATVPLGARRARVSEPCGRAGSDSCQSKGYPGGQSRVLLHEGALRLNGELSEEFLTWISVGAVWMFGGRLLRFRGGGWGHRDRWQCQGGWVFSRSGFRRAASWFRAHCTPGQHSPRAGRRVRDLSFAGGTTSPSRAFGSRFFHAEFHIGRGNSECPHSCARLVRQATVLNRIPTTTRPGSSFVWPDLSRFRPSD